MNVKWMPALALAGLMIVGCEKQENATAPSGAAQTTANSASETANEATGAAKEAAGNVANSAQEAAGTAAKTAEGAAKEATGSATTEPGAAASASDSQAKKLIDEATSYVKENKYDLADKALTQAEGMKSSLSPTMQSALEKARTALTAAKAGAGKLSVPALPGASQ